MIVFFLIHFSHIFLRTFSTQQVISVNPSSVLEPFPFIVIFDPIILLFDTGNYLPEIHIGMKLPVDWSFDDDALMICEYGNQVSCMIIIAQWK